MVKEPNGSKDHLYLSGQEEERQKCSRELMREVIYPIYEFRRSLENSRFQLPRKAVGELEKDIKTGSSPMRGNVE